MKNDFILRLKGAYLELTSECNASCPYCYNESNSQNKDFLPLENVLEIIDELSISDFPAIVLSGGEPFLYPYISQILNYAWEKRVKPTIITNGMLLSCDRIVSLLQRDVSIQLTFDSIISTEHNKTRGVGNFEKLIEILSIAHTESHEDKLMIRYNINKQNYDHVDSFIDFLKGYGIHAATFSFLHKTGRAKNFPLVFDYYEDSLLLYRILQNFRAKEVEYAEKKDFSISYGELDHVLGCAYFADGKIDSSPRIDAKGNVYPCQVFTGDENSLGNIVVEHSLHRILESTLCHNVIERIRDRKSKLKDKCVRCPYDNFCMGGCPAMAYNSTGNLYTVDKQCYFIKFCFKNNYNTIEKNTKKVEKQSEDCVF